MPSSACASVEAISAFRRVRGPMQSFNGISSYLIASFEWPGAGLRHDWTHPCHFHWKTWTWAHTSRYRAKSQKHLFHFFHRFFNKCLPHSERHLQEKGQQWLLSQAKTVGSLPKGPCGSSLTVQVYDLAAVCVHDSHDGSVSRGHYTAYGRSADGESGLQFFFCLFFRFLIQREDFVTGMRWYNFNDSSVQQCAAERVASEKVPYYMMRHWMHWTPWTLWGGCIRPVLHSTWRPDHATHHYCMNMFAGNCWSCTWRKNDPFCGWDQLVMSQIWIFSVVLLLW